MLVSGLLANCSYSGVIYPYHLKVPFWIQRHKEIRFKDYNTGQFASRKIPRESIQYSLVGRIGTRCVTSVGRNHPELRFDDDIHKESYWSSLSKEALRALRALFEFLVEQPSQLKYIEWPSFQSTLKTATLTLILVALLIVALSSVDSCLSFLLALLLRKTP